MASGKFWWRLRSQSGSDEEESQKQKYWDVTSIQELLHKIGLPVEYAKSFEGMDFAHVMSLDETELKEIGVPTFGARRRLAVAFTELKLLKSNGPGVLLSAYQAYAP